MKTTFVTSAVTMALAGSVIAHSGVRNATVKARMDLMVRIKDATAVVGGMAQGKIAFDASKAKAARQALIGHAKEIGPAFKARETDPNSEARESIWTDWKDFRSKAGAMAVAARALDTRSRAGLAAGMAPLGASCQGCHKLYWIEK